MLEINEELFSKKIYALCLEKKINKHGRIYSGREFAIYEGTINRIIVEMSYDNAGLQYAADISTSILTESGQECHIGIQNLCVGVDCYFGRAEAEKELNRLNKR